MGTNPLNRNYNQDPYTSAVPQELRDALVGTIVGRDPITGVAGDGIADVGTAALPFGTGYFKRLSIGGMQVPIDRIGLAGSWADGGLVPLFRGTGDTANAGLGKGWRKVLRVEGAGGVTDNTLAVWPGGHRYLATKTTGVMVQVQTPRFNSGTLVRVQVAAEIGSAPPSYGTATANPDVLNGSMRMIMETTYPATQQGSGVSALSSPILNSWEQFGGPDRLPSGCTPIVEVVTTTAPSPGNQPPTITNATVQTGHTCWTAVPAPVGSFLVVYVRMYLLQTFVQGFSARDYDGKAAPIDTTTGFPRSPFGRVDVWHL